MKAMQNGMPAHICHLLYSFLVLSVSFRTSSRLLLVNFSGWNTSKVSDMYGLFTGCSSLKYLDLSNFDMGNISANNRTAMFYDCSELDVLLLPSGDSNYPAQKYSKFSFQNTYPNRIFMPDLSFPADL